MATIGEMLRKFQSLDLRNEVPRIVERTKEKIIEANQQQLYSGEDKNNQKLNNYRSAPYAHKKHEMNSKPGFGIPDLFLTGEFYKGFKVTVKKDEFDIGSENSKERRLENKYGTQIFGLTDKNKEVYAHGVLFQGIKQYIEGKTGLKFQ